MQISDQYSILTDTLSPAIGISIGNGKMVSEHFFFSELKKNKKKIAFAFQTFVRIRRNKPAILTFLLARFFILNALQSVCNH